jgi:hypothetical protein
MTGSIRKRGAAAWEIRVYAGIDPDTGKPRYRSATVHGNRADAERGLERFVAVASSVKAIGSSSAVSELLEAWFAIASVSWAPTTIRQTRSVLDRYLHPHLGGQRVGDVTSALIDATYATLRVSGGMGGKPLGAGSLARVHVVLRSAFSQAQRWGWVWDNPVALAHRIVVPPHEMRPPTPAELRELSQHIAANDAMFHTFVLLAAITGARRSQLLGLRWEDVNHSMMRVSFRSGWVEGPDGQSRRLGGAGKPKLSVLLRSRVALRRRRRRCPLARRRSWSAVACRTTSECCSGCRSRGDRPATTTIRTADWRRAR